MPWCESSPLSPSEARLLVYKTGLPSIIIPLSPFFQSRKKKDEHPLNKHFTLGKKFSAQIWKEIFNNTIH